MTGIGNTLYMEEQAGIDSFATQMQAEECEPLVIGLKISRDNKRLRTGPCLIRGELKSSARDGWNDLCLRTPYCEMAKDGNIFDCRCSTNKYAFTYCEAQFR